VRTLAFLVQGSQPEPYRVVFTYEEGGRLSASCTCRAGQIGQYCKHRMAILSGRPVDIVNGTAANLAEVASWLAGSDVETALLELAKCEDEMARAKQAASAAKRAVARALRD
jgi:hypothetical protein